MMPGTQGQIPSDSMVLSDDYRSALESYLKGDGEHALQRAYEMGRDALARGVGLLELARTHHLCLEALLTQAGSPRQRDVIHAGAVNFFAECISPYEMTYRGFRDANSALRSFNGLLEREAKRIARSLHDEAGQLLVAVYIALVNLANELPQAATRIAGITGLLDQMEEELRRLSHELAPAILDDFGLVPALKYLAEGVARRTGLKIVIEDAPEVRWPQSVESVFYRFAQESLANAVRHARATEVTIRFHRDPAAICCRIRDNGIGFDPNRVSSSVSEPGFGLTGIRERAQSLGGTLFIDSAIGAGTELAVSIPVDG